MCVKAVTFDVYASGRKVGTIRATNKERAVNAAKVIYGAMYKTGTIAVKTHDPHVGGFTPRETRTEAEEATQ